MNTQDLGTSLQTATQIPLNAKLYILALEDLTNLGDGNYKAFLYYEDMVVQCVETHKNYIWRELISTGINPLTLTVDGVSYDSQGNETPTAPGTGFDTTQGYFKYPNNTPEINGIDYSNRIFTFYEYQRLTDEQYNRVQDSVYQNLSQSISVSPTSFEKGVETDLVFTWRVTKNDDTLNTVTVDGQDKLSEATGVNRTYNVNNQVNSKTVSLVTGYTRNNTTGGSGSVTNSATSTARIPQFYGLLDTLEPSDYEYDTLNSSLTKYVGTSTTFNIVTISSTPKYVVFITTKSNASIEESGFGVSVGDFNSTSGFWKKQVSITLADGSNQTLYIYVSSEPLTTINHKLS